MMMMDDSDGVEPLIVTFAANIQKCNNERPDPVLDRLGIFLNPGLSGLGRATQMSGV